jgi:hypothetical protein
MITANQPFGAWDQIFPDPAMTIATIDRLVHHGLAPVKWRGIASTDRLFFELCGAEVVERRMAPNGVVEAIDISGNVALGFGAGEEGGSPNQFRFQRLEEGLDHRVVVAIALARH